MAGYIIHSRLWRGKLSTKMNVPAEVAGRLLQIKAIKLSPQNPFTWASGLRSPIYCDNRLILSYPKIRQLITSCFETCSQVFQPFDAIAGVATAGIAHGVLLADRLELPFAYVRDKAKGHGRQNQIEGELRPGARVLVIEDLISTGGSSLAAVAALREAGLEVIGVLAVFTYGFERAAAEFARADCRLGALSNYASLIEQAENQGYITSSELETLKSWSVDPEGWSRKWTETHP